MDQQPGQQIGLQVNILEKLGEKQVRLEAALEYAQALERENGGLKAALDESASQIEGLHKELETKKGDLRTALDIIEDLKDEMSVLNARVEADKGVPAPITRDL